MKTINLLKFFSFLFIFCLFLSCDKKDEEQENKNSSSSAASNKHVDNICGCLDGTEIIDVFKNSQISSQRDLPKALGNATKDLSENDMKKIGKCILKVAKEMRDEMANLKDNEKGEYVKNFIVSALENECLSFVYQLVPFNELEEGMDEAIGDMERKLNGSSRDNSSYDGSKKASPHEGNGSDDWR